MEKREHYRAIELFGILIIGSLQPIVEIVWDSQMATYYNILAALIVLFYLAYRISHLGRNIFREWGIRTDNWTECVRPYLYFVLLSIVLLYGYGYVVGTTPLPKGFWYVLGIYPVWGFAQQFVLQNFIARHLRGQLSSVGMKSATTAVVFACAHIPSLELFVLTLVSGFCFTYLYHQYQNLWILGIAHGILGALVFHLVLGQDQWEILQQYFI